MTYIPALPPGQTTFRDTVYRLCPRWLQGTNGERLIYSIAIMLDALTDATTAAIRYRFPGEYTNQSLAQLGRERKMLRGRVETDEDYSRRLVEWFAAHSHRGGPTEMLRQLHYFWAAAFEMELINEDGLRFLVDTDGNITHDELAAWTPGGVDSNGCRWWLFLHWPNTVNNDGNWEDAGVWSDGGVWDSDLSAVEVRDIQAIPAEWNAAHIKWGYIVLLNDGETALWDYPPGLWDEMGDTWEAREPASVILSW